MFVWASKDGKGVLRAVYVGLFLFSLMVYESGEVDGAIKKKSTGTDGKVRVIIRREKVGGARLVNVFNLRTPPLLYSLA